MSENLQAGDPPDGARRWLLWPAQAGALLGGVLLAAVGALAHAEVSPGAQVGALLAIGAAAMAGAMTVGFPRRAQGRGEVAVRAAAVLLVGLLSLTAAMAWLLFVIERLWRVPGVRPWVQRIGGPLVEETALDGGAMVVVGLTAVAVLRVKTGRRWLGGRAAAAGWALAVLGCAWGLSLRMQCATGVRPACEALARRQEYQERERLRQQEQAAEEVMRRSPIRQVTPGEVAAMADEIAAPLPDELRAMQKACDGGAAPACASLAERHWGAYGPLRNRVRAAALARRACEGGEASGCGLLGEAYAQGYGVEQDGERALGLGVEACGKGNGRGCLQAGLLLEEGKLVERDEPRGRELQRRACELGERRGCPRGSDGERRLPGPPGESQEERIKRELALAEARCPADAAACSEAAERTRDQIPWKGDPQAHDREVLEKAGPLWRKGCDGGYAPACQRLSFFATDRGELEDAFVKMLLGGLSDWEAEGRLRQRGGSRLISALSRRACEQGSALGCVSLARELNLEERQERKRLEERACQLGRADLCPKVVHAESLPLVLRGCSLGDGGACLLVAQQLLAQGTDPRVIDELLGRGCNPASVDDRRSPSGAACELLARRLGGDERSQAQAARLLHHGCYGAWGAGVGASCLALAERVHDGRGTARDEAFAVELLALACLREPSVCPGPWDSSSDFERDPDRGKQRVGRMCRERGWACPAEKKP